MLDEGQKQAPQLMYADLPQNVAEKVRAAIKQINTGNGGSAGH
jgi:hypothetical protein